MCSDAQVPCKWKEAIIEIFIVHIFTQHSYLLLEMILCLMPKWVKGSIKFVKAFMQIRWSGVVGFRFEFVNNLLTICYKFICYSFIIYFLTKLVTSATFWIVLVCFLVFTRKHTKKHCFWMFCGERMKRPLCVCVFCECVLECCARAADVTHKSNANVRSGTTAHRALTARQQTHAALVSYRSNVELKMFNCSKCC